MGTAGSVSTTAFAGGTASHRSHGSRPTSTRSSSWLVTSARSSRASPRAARMVTALLVTPYRLDDRGVFWAKEVITSRPAWAHGAGGHGGAFPCLTLVAFEASLG